MRTGHPLTVAVGRDPTVIPDSNERSDQRPDPVPGVPIIPPGQNPKNWVNVNAFAIPAGGTFSNPSCGLVRGPRAWQIDIGLSKHSRINERLSLDFRAETLDIFDNAEYADPSALDITFSDLRVMNTPPLTMTVPAMSLRAMSVRDGHGRLSFRWS
jgi:hypothetical protein